nr:hypothetical protein SFRURICE_004831 [Spodoptera frugiperda]
MSNKTTSCPEHKDNDQHLNSKQDQQVALKNRLKPNKLKVEKYDSRIEKSSQIKKETIITKPEPVFVKVEIPNPLTVIPLIENNESVNGMEQLDDGIVSEHEELIPESIGQVEIEDRLNKTNEVDSKPTNGEKKSRAIDLQLKCDDCGETFRTKSTNVVCFMCGMFVDNEEKLALHQKRHMEQNFVCRHCDKGFFLRESLRRHLAKIHDDLSPDSIEQSKPVNVKQECPVENKLNS